MTHSKQKVNGKMHYVISDIHGQYARYQKLLEKIEFSDSDTLYVLGDCIDRGPYPIDVLLDVLDRKNAHLLMGNHEKMMLDAYKDSGKEALWFRNGAEVTARQLSALGWFKKKRLMKKIENLPLVIPNLKVGEKTFYLAHASHAAAYIGSTLKYSEADVDTANQILWSREYINAQKGNVMAYCLIAQYKELYAMYPKDTTLICGHTPVYRCAYGKTNTCGHGRISKTMKGHLINIDCGGAIGRQLGCLRLEDMQEFYC